ncbi:DUF429 domain-containing protein [Shewanella fodinae]|uniref:Uncharacterized protein DUF429 n=1 Tax=Shewanella fodinae TaxID=552357 RepID=A0A4R2F323_9GAMM|nr:DUF429 domain-containing protein [Shewanella fodinae]TCN78037.1 uncharacterized protein DUF429 [Shewanella fodinae]
MLFIGLDPGGKEAFGWCVILVNGDEVTKIIGSGVTSSLYVAIERLKAALEQSPTAAGIDAPLYWVLDGERRADQLIRVAMKQAGGMTSTVQHVNSLRGACLVQGVLSAVALRSEWANIQITESHPKAVLALNAEIARLVQQHEFATEHERDAFIAACCAWLSSSNESKWVDLVGFEHEKIHWPSGFPVRYVHPL